MPPAGLRSIEESDGKAHCPGHELILRYAARRFEPTVRDAEMTVHDEDWDVPSPVSGRVVREIPIEDAVSGLFGVARHAVRATAAGIGAVLQNMPWREHGEPVGGRGGAGAASLWALRLFSLARDSWRHNGRSAIG